MLCPLEGGLLCVAPIKGEAFCWPSPGWEVYINYWNCFAWETCLFASTYLFFQLFVYISMDSWAFTLHCELLNRYLFCYLFYTHWIGYFFLPCKQDSFFYFLKQSFCDLLTLVESCLSPQPQGLFMVLLAFPEPQSVIYQSTAGGDLALENHPVTSSHVPGLLMTSGNSNVKFNSSQRVSLSVTKHLVSLKHGH